MNTALHALLALLLTSRVVFAEDEELKFKITTKKKGDTVEFRANGDKVLFIVTSPFGIGQAVIEREAMTWPKGVALRLRLKGLESFKVSSGKATLQAAVSVVEGKAQTRQWKDGKEDAPLDEKSPFWMDVRVIGSDGKPAGKLPLKDGYFELTLPRAFFEGAPPSITVSWIDFYRG
ncbi:MAG: hypothetical protein U0793_11660 [Gemmataceae bacterium]